VQTDLKKLMEGRERKWKADLSVKRETGNLELAELIGHASCGADLSQAFTWEIDSVASLSHHNPVMVEKKTELRRTTLLVSRIFLRPADILYDFRR
jgi:hypothetical protein